MTIDVGKLTQELVDAEISVISVDENETILLETEDDRAAANAILAAHDPTDYVAARRTDARADYKELDTIYGMTADQAVDWVDTNVTDLASAKVALKKIVRPLVLMARAGDIEDI